MAKRSKPHRSQQRVRLTASAEKHWWGGLESGFFPIPPRASCAQANNNNNTLLPPMRFAFVYLPTSSPGNRPCTCPMLSLTKTNYLCTLQKNPGNLDTKKHKEVIQHFVYEVKKKSKGFTRLNMHCHGSNIMIVYCSPLVDLEPQPHSPTPPPSAPTRPSAAPPRHFVQSGANHRTFQ